MSARYDKAHALLQRWINEHGADVNIGDDRLLTVREVRDALEGNPDTPSLVSTLLTLCALAPMPGAFNGGRTVEERAANQVRYLVSSKLFYGNISGDLSCDERFVLGRCVKSLNGVIGMMRAGAHGGGVLFVVADMLSRVVTSRLACELGYHR